MARQYLRIRKEAIWGTAPAALGTLNTDYVVAEIDAQAAGFTMRVVPTRRVIMSSGVGNRRRKVYSVQDAVAGNFTTLFFPSQAKFLLDMATAFGSGELAGYTFEHCVQMDNLPGRTRVYRQYLGAKADQWALTASSTEAFKLAIDLTAQKPGATLDNTSFPEPPAADYPSEDPFVLNDLADFVLGGARVELDDFSFTIRNTLGKPFHESRYITRAQYLGRQVDLGCRLLYQSAQDRVDFEQLNAKACSFSITDGTKIFSFDLQDNCDVAELQDQLNEDNPFYQTVGVQAYVDPATGTDLAVAYDDGE